MWHSVIWGWYWFPELKLLLRLHRVEGLSTTTQVSRANVRSYLSVVSLCALLQWLMLTLVRVSRRPTMWHAQSALCPTSREARGKHYLATPGRVLIGWARRRVGGALTNVLWLPLRWLLMCKYMWLVHEHLRTGCLWLRGSDVWTCCFFFVEGIIVTVLDITGKPFGFTTSSVTLWSSAGVSRGFVTGS